jgi:hypothetical protein
LSPPGTEKAYEEYIVKFKQSNHTAYFINKRQYLYVGVFNISAIVKGVRKVLTLLLLFQKLFQ